LVSSVLPTPVGPKEHERANRPVRVLQAGTRTAHGGRDRMHRFGLADDALGKLLFHATAASRARLPASCPPECPSSGHHLGNRGCRADGLFDHHRVAPACSGFGLGQLGSSSGMRHRQAHPPWRGHPGAGPAQARAGLVQLFLELLASLSFSFSACQRVRSSPTFLLKVGQLGF
jgi:hypothetical protein